MKFLEFVYYESLPYAYAGLAVFAFMNYETSKLAGIAAVILSFCSYYVLSKRYNYRMFSSRYNHNKKV